MLDLKLLERRETLLKHMVKGASLQAAAEDMTLDILDPYEREKAIWVIRKDWSNRDRWIDSIVRLRDGSFFAELVGAIQEASKHCWIEFAKSKSSNAKIGALRTIIMGKTRLGLLLMKAGVIEQAPQRVESTMTIAGTPFDVDPELKKLLISEFERQREEKAHAIPGAVGSGQK